MDRNDNAKSGKNAGHGGLTAGAEHLRQEPRTSPILGGVSCAETLANPEPKNKPGRSDRATRRADAYLEQLRWIVQTADRLSDEVARLRHMPEAMQALQCLGSYETLAYFAKKYQIEPVKEPNPLAHRPFDEVVWRFKRELEEKRQTLEAFEGLLAERKPPAALYGRMHNMTAEAASELSAEDIRLQTQFETSHRLPKLGDELQRISDKWISCAVEDAALLVDAPKDRALNEKAARSLYWARDCRRDYKRVQTFTAKELEPAPSYEEQIQRVGKELKKLLRDPRVQDALKGRTNRGKKGAKSAACELVSIFCADPTLKARSVDQATTRHARRLKELPSHILR